MNAWKRTGLAVGVGVCAFVGCIVVALSSRIGPSAAPLLKVGYPDQTSIEVIPGVSSEIEFLVANDGGSELRIHDLTPTCGCTSATAEPPRLRPGQAGRLIVRFNPPPEPATFAHSIDFRTNDPEHLSTRVAFSGRASWPIEVQPIGLDLRVAESQTPASASLELFSPAGKSFAIESIITSDSWLHVHEEKNVLEPHRRRLIVRADSFENTTRKTGSIRVVTSARDRPVLMIPVSLEVLASARVTPKRVMLTPTRIDSVARAKFFLYQNEDLKITKVDASGEDWTVQSWEAQPNGTGLGITCEVVFKAPRKPGYSRFKLTFYRENGQVPGQAELSALVVE